MRALEPGERWNSDISEGSWLISRKSDKKKKEKRRWNGILTMCVDLDRKQVNNGCTTWSSHDVLSGSLLQSVWVNGLHGRVFVFFFFSVSFSASLSSPPPPFGLGMGRWWWCARGGGGHREVSIRYSHCRLRRISTSIEILITIKKN